MTARHLQLRCALLALAIVLGGCVYSVESVITESSAAFDARLLGDWKDVGSSEHAVVTRSIRNGYTIEYGSDDTVSRYEAHLGRLGDRLILDVSVPPEDSSPSASGQLPIAWHVVFSLDVSEDEIRVAPIGGDSLTAAIRAGHVRLAAHARSAFCPAMCAPTDLILDGTTEELRDALGSYLASPGAPEPPIVYRRMPRARTAAPTPTTHADSSIE
jgi:hypothetical protein